MHRVLKKDQILTIPNLLSIVRLALIPVIIWLYCGLEKYYAAAAVIVLSGVTDIADGIIARKFNMVSDFGKILDPIADKLTQAAIIICLTFKHKMMLVLIAIFAVKELSMTVMGYLALKLKDSVNSAKWYGKVNTVLLYGVLLILIMLPGLSETAANVLIGISGAFMIFTLIMYIRFYGTVFGKSNREKS